MYGAKDLTWTDNCLRYGRRTVAAIEPDGEWPGMWRVRLTGLSDMVNRTRAKDAAMCLALGVLNTRERRVEAPRICHFEGAATSTPDAQAAIWRG